MGYTLALTFKRWCDKRNFASDASSSKRAGAAGGGVGQALLKISGWQRRIGATSPETGRWTRTHWGRHTPLHARKNFIGTNQRAAPRPGARG